MVKKLELRTVLLLLQRLENTPPISASAHLHHVRVEKCLTCTGWAVQLLLEPSHSLGGGLLVALFVAIN